MGVTAIPARAEVGSRLATASRVPWLLGALGVLGLAIAARVGVGSFAALGGRELFRDEAASWLLAGEPIGTILRRTAAEVYPPLYPILLSAWTHVAGDSEAALRLLSVLAGLVALGATWTWASQALGAGPGLVAAALFALSPLAIQDARTVRMYALETAFAAVAWWLVWRLVAGRAGTGWRRVAEALVLALAVAGEVWTLALGIPVAVLQLAVPIGLAAAPVVLGSRPAARQPARAVRRGDAAVAAVAVLAGTVSFVPWLPQLVGAAGRGSFWTTAPSLLSVPETLVSMIGSIPDLGVASGPSLVVVAPIAVALGLATAVLALVGLLALVRSPGRPDRITGCVTVAGLALIPGVAAVSLWHPIYDTRYLEAALPPFVLAIAAGVGPAARSLGRWRSRRGANVAGERAGAAPAVAIAGALVAASIVTSTSWLAAWQEPAAVAWSREVVAAALARVRPGDVVLATDARSYFPLAYYAARAATDGDGRTALIVRSWDSGTEPFFYGQSLIDPTVTITAADVASRGLRAALGATGPTSRLWLVTVANGNHVRVGFAPLDGGALKPLSRTLFGPPGDESGQLIELPIP